MNWIYLFIGSIIMLYQIWLENEPLRLLGISHCTDSFLGVLWVQSADVNTTKVFKCRALTSADKGVFTTKLHLFMFFTAVNFNAI